jgi:proline iminopeptidase
MRLFHPRLFNPTKVRLQGFVPGAGVDGPQVYYETRGHPGRQPVLISHGGPARGFKRTLWQIFNPSHFNIVLVDQMGCGNSTPAGLLEGNTTPAQIEMFEAIRKRLGIEKWVVYGCGSGAALALFYAEQHPEVVSGVILANSLTYTPEEKRWLFGYPLSDFFPTEFSEFQGHVHRSGGSLLEAYYDALTHGTEAEQKEAVEGWTKWERTISGLPEELFATATYDELRITAKIAAHYFVNGGFFQPATQLFDNLHVIREHEIQGVIVHGDGDHVTPIARIQPIIDACPTFKLVTVHGAGHSPTDMALQEALLDAAAEFGDCGCLVKFPWQKKNSK